METDELLKNLRIIVREEMTQFSERMDVRFDHVYTLFDGMYARLDRLDAQIRSINGILAHIAPYDHPLAFRTCRGRI